MTRNALWVFALLVSSRGAAAEVWPLTAPEARLRVHTAQLVVAAADETDEADVWTWRFEVSGRGRAGLAFAAELGPEAVRVERALAPALLAIEHASAPRFVERPAWDPCIFGLRGYARIPPRSLDHPWPLGPINWTAAWPEPQAPALDAADFHRLGGDGPSAHGLAAPDRQSMAAEASGLLTFTATDARRWTPPVQVRRRRAARGEIALGPLAAHAPPGRLVKLELFTLAGGTGLEPRGPRFDLPSEIALPEVTFEHPEDTRRAIVRQIRITRGDDALVRGFRGRARDLDAQALSALGAPAAATLTRFSLAFGSGGRPPLALAPTPPGEPRLAPFWLIHRVWRAPLACPPRDRYLAAVAKQQALVHRTFANMTGRPLDAVIELSRARGYLLEPLRRIGQVPPDALELQPVEVDRSAW